MLLLLPIFHVRSVHSGQTCQDFPEAMALHGVDSQLVHERIGRVGVHVELLSLALCLHPSSTVCVSSILRSRAYVCADKINHSLPPRPSQLWAVFGGFIHGIETPRLETTASKRRTKGETGCV